MDNTKKSMLNGKMGRYETRTGVIPKKQPWFRRLLSIVVVLLATELINLTLWQLGAIPSVPSIFMSEILTCAISFLAGRVYERFCK